MLVVGLTWAMAASAQPVAVTKRILVLPTLQWNDTASTWDYAVRPDAAQITTLLGGLRFGMSPEDVGQHLPGRSSALHWDDLPESREFSQDVRYVLMPMQAADTLLNPIKSCYGNSSYVLLLFFNKALFRVSWRFLPDETCRDPRDAAEDLFAAFVPIAPSVVISAHYSAGNAQVIDVTAPDAGPLLPVRWRR